MQRQVSGMPHVLFGSLLVPYYRNPVPISLSTKGRDGLSKVTCLGIVLPSGRVGSRCSDNVDKNRPPAETSC